jgi:hypothetical protein
MPDDPRAERLVQLALVVFALCSVGKCLPPPATKGATPNLRSSKARPSSPHLALTVAVVVPGLAVG